MTTVVVDAPIDKQISRVKCEKERIVARHERPPILEISSPDGRTIFLVDQKIEQSDLRKKRRMPVT